MGSSYEAMQSKWVKVNFIGFSENSHPFYCMISYDWPNVLFYPHPYLSHISYIESKTKIQIKCENIVSGESTYSVWMRIGKTHGQFIWSYAVKMSQSKFYRFQWEKSPILLHDLIPLAICLILPSSILITHFLHWIQDRDSNQVQEYYISGESTYSVWTGIGKTHGQFIWSYAVKMSQNKIS